METDVNMIGIKRHFLIGCYLCSWKLVECTRCIISNDAINLEQDCIVASRWISVFVIGRYESSVSGHYDWHQDSLGTWNSIHNKPNRPNLHGKARKISMSLILNDDYEGGELEIFGQPKDYYGQGSMIFFPSWMLHRVTPVTKGIRYSLVMWHIGAPFR